MSDSPTSTSPTNGRKPTSDSSGSTSASASAPVTADLLSQDAASAKRYRKLLDQLVAIGIEQLIDVPKVVVVGSQSAGKSSILEALSGITFPRASGTCTRCPSEVRLFSSNESWTCTVSLRIEKDVKGNRLDQVKVIPFGPLITDPEDVQARLLQAQKAILNPSKSYLSFLKDAQTTGNDRGRRANEVQFSENVICIDVKGKDLRDLSVIDLPGIIANVGQQEDEGNIDLIRNLAKKEIAKENCVILLCISMNEDYQNQPSVTLAREADPTVRRTLGVLTKPDRIEEGTFDNWRPILKGREQKLLHGYYVVKNPDPKQLGQVSWEQARADEKKFFSKEPWSTLGSSIVYRLGAIHLAAKLATLLEEVVTASVPGIVSEVNALDSEATMELDELPAQVSEDRTLLHFSSLLVDFDNDFRQQILGSYEGSLADDLYNISLDFWADMINHRPRFLPLTASELQKLSDLSMTETPNGLKKIIEVRDYIFEEDRAELKARGISQQSDLGHEEGKDLVPLLSNITQSTTLYGSFPDSEKIEEERILMTLSDISRIKARATRDLLPCDPPSTFKADMIVNMCTKTWTRITSQTIKKIETCLLDECEKLINKHFSPFKAGGLDETISRIMESLIADRVKKTEAFVSDLVSLETWYSTISTKDVSWRQRVLKTDLVEARKACCIKIEGQDTTERFNESVTEELSFVAEIRAYWQVAYSRYTDNVRSALNAFLLRPIAADCLETLKSELDVSNDDASSMVKSFLPEDQDIVQRRNELMARQATLKKSLDVINAFKSGGRRVGNDERDPKRAKHHH